MLRQATLADHPALALLWQRAWHSASPGITVVEPLAHWQARVADELVAPSQVHLLELDGVIAGFAAFNPDRAHLAQLMIDPAYQGRGLGSQLLLHVCQCLPAGFKLHTATDNHVAIRFYERHGLTHGEVDLHPSSGRERVLYRWLPPV